MNAKMLTYGQLEYLLQELGYRLTYREGGPRIWENKEFDAVKLLPAEPAEAPARIHHLMTVRKVSIEKGIVEEAIFEKLLEKAYQHQSGSVVSSTAA